MTPVRNYSLFVADTREELLTFVVDTREELLTFVVDTSEELLTGVVDTCETTKLQQFANLNGTVCL
jgi:hypothetical protein